VIVSPDNRYIKLMRSLARRKIRLDEGAFLVEGRRLAEEAVAHVGVVRAVVVREDIDPHWVAGLRIEQSRVHWAAKTVFDAASNVEHAQGIAAICNLPELQNQPHQFGGGPGFVLVLDRLRDPGNMGTALRSAAAAGIRTVFVTEGTVDPFSTKCLRAGMGAHFRLSIELLSPTVRQSITTSGVDVVLGDAQAQESIYTFDWRTDQVIVISGETETLSPHVASMVTHRVSIPMDGDMESLNVGVAATILMYEARRQVSGRADIV
jgi:TrmH family RNA methyltransferase